jgi:phosphoribosylformylglycinamidine cyclo-ligase
VHSNGFSLVRHVLLDIGRLPLDGHVEEFGRTLGEELLEPCRIYALDCLALRREADVHAFAHVTGGGLVGNLARVIPPGLTAGLDRRVWNPPPVFGFIAARGRVARDEMEKAFNMGIGMVAVVSAEEADRAMAVLMARHVPSVILGTVEPSVDGSTDRVLLSGDHLRF